MFANNQQWTSDGQNVFLKTCNFLYFALPPLTLPTPPYPYFGKKKLKERGSVFSCRFDALMARLGYVKVIKALCG